MADLIVTGRHLVVSTSPWSNDFKYNWTRRADLKVVGNVREVSGSLPSSVTLAGYRDPDAEGHIYQALPGKAVQWRLPTGEDGNLLMPHGLPPYSFVKVEIYNGDEMEKLRFLGLITKVKYSHKTCRVSVMCEDFRCVLHRIKCKGSKWRLPLRATTNYIPDLGPHFNAGGKPDMWADSDGDSVLDFITPLHNLTDDMAVVDSGAARADFWSCGDALNALRKLFYDDVPSGLDDVSSFITWPSYVRVGSKETETDVELDSLFFDAVTSGACRVNDLNCTGKPLAWAIDQAVSASGPNDWYLKPSGEEGEEKATLVVYPVASVDGTADGDLAMGELGGSIADVMPEITDMDLDMDFRDIYAVVRAVGAPRRVNTTVTDAGAAISGDEFDDYIANGGDFPTLLTVFGADQTTDWATIFTHSVFNPTGVFTERGMRAHSEIADLENQIGVKVWRYYDSAWEVLPDHLRARPYGEAGVILPIGAREEYWSWDGAAVGPETYDIRCTVSVDTEDRIFYRAEESGFGLNVPPGELYLPLGQRYQYVYRRKCWLPVRDGKPVDNSSTEQEFGASADDVIRDDTDQLGAVANRMLKQTARPKLRGWIEVSELREDLVPGYMIGQLSGGGLRDDLDIYQAVRSVELDEENQTTKLYLEVI